MVGCYVIKFGCWWEPWGEVDPIIGTIRSGFFRKSGGKMASQRIISASHLTVAIHPIGTRPMEAESGVMVVVIFIVMENKGEIGMDSDHFCPIFVGGCVVVGGVIGHESR